VRSEEILESSAGLHGELVRLLVEPLERVGVRPWGGRFPSCEQHAAALVVHDVGEPISYDIGEAVELESTLVLGPDTHVLHCVPEQRHPLLAQLAGAGGEDVLWFAS